MWRYTSVFLVFDLLFSAKSTIGDFDCVCASISNLLLLCDLSLQRPSKVRVSAQDLSGQRFTINISAFPARIFQHEFDHLQGVLFCDRWVPEGMEKHRSELVDMEDTYMQQHPNEAIQRIG